MMTAGICKGSPKTGVRDLSSKDDTGGVRVTRRGGKVQLSACGTK